MSVGAAGVVGCVDFRWHSRC